MAKNAIPSAGLSTCLIGNGSNTYFNQCMKLPSADHAAGFRPFTGASHQRRRLLPWVLREGGPFARMTCRSIPRRNHTEHQWLL